MDRIGLAGEVFHSAYDIDLGRKSLTTKGMEPEGRILYEQGISTVLFAFQEAQRTVDPETIILVEYTFLGLELQFCSEIDTDTRSSLNQAIQNFDDAFRCLKTVEDAVGYRYVETTYLTNPKCRIQGLPKDAFHLACISHRTRLHNVLRSPGINMIEKAVLTQRAANMTAAQGGYIEKQKKALYKI